MLRCAARTKYACALVWGHPGRTGYSDRTERGGCILDRVSVFGMQDFIVHASSGRRSPEEWLGEDLSELGFVVVGWCLDSWLVKDTDSLVFQVVIRVILSLVSIAEI